MKKILVVSSPTGGHLYPAISVSKELLKSGYKIIFVTQQGTKFVDIIDSELSSGYVVETIPSGKFYRKNPFKIIHFLTLLIFSIIKSIKIFLVHQPKMIFSTGGYTSFPIIVVGKILFPEITLILQEQNYVFGLANKILKLFATKVCLAFPSELTKNKKYIYTGNPIRENFKIQIDTKKIYDKFGLDNNKLTILVFGGSQGAKSINSAIINMFNVQYSLLNNIQVIHITGKNDFERIKKEYENIKIKNVVLPYLSKMEEAYNIADLVISRAGAMTVSELIHFKKPAILIPYPYATEFHQNWNAEYLRKNGCAEVVYEHPGWKNILIQKISVLVNNQNLLHKLSSNYNNLLLPKNTIKNIIETIK